MADLDDDVTPRRPRRRGPVRVRLTAPSDLDVLHILDLLRDAVTVSDVSPLLRLRRDGGYAVYCTVQRRTPLRGGER